MLLFIYIHLFIHLFIYFALILLDNINRGYCITTIITRMLHVVYNYFKTFCVEVTMRRLFRHPRFPLQQMHNMNSLYKLNL